MILLQKSTLLSLLAISSVEATKKWREGSHVPFSVKALSPGGNSYDGNLYLHPVNYYDPTLNNPGPALQEGCYDDTIYDYDEFFGNHFFNGPFNLTFNDQSARCKLLGDKYYKKDNVQLINDLIKKNYKLNFFVDDIPVGRELYDSQTGKFYIDNGVPLGYVDINKIPHLFNHFQFIVYYVTEGLDFTILYATVSTQSLTRVTTLPLTCSLSPPLLLRYSDYAYNGNRITYDVFWKELSVNSKISTWDLYKNDVVRPLVSISIFLMFSFLTLVIGGYTYSTFSYAFNVEKLNAIYKIRSRESVSYNDFHNKHDDHPSDNSSSSSLSDDKDFGDSLEFSWPSLAYDVFRKPEKSSALFYLISQGSHFALIATLIIVQLGIGWIKLHGQGKSLTKSIFHAFILTSPLPSITYSYFFKKFETSTQSTISTYKRRLLLALFMNSCVLPMISFIFIHQINRAHREVKSPIQIPTHNYHTLVIPYILITFFSFVISLRFWKPSQDRVNEISKKISTPPITFRIIPNMIITGLFPFGVILVPLSTIYLTLWFNHFLVVGCLVYAYLLLVVLLIIISVLGIYYSLSIGNWQWQWYSFLGGTSIGFYAFVYAFYLTKFRFGDHSSYLIFLTQNSIISLILGLVGGFISFFSSYLLVRKLYSGIQQ